jgi:hypothetical protein
MANAVNALTLAIAMVISYQSISTPLTQPLTVPLNVGMVSKDSLKNVMTETKSTATAVLPIVLSKKLGLVQPIFPVPAAHSKTLRFLSQSRKS